MKQSAAKTLGVAALGAAFAAAGAGAANAAPVVPELGPTVDGVVRTLPAAERLAQAAPGAQAPGAKGADAKGTTPGADARPAAAQSVADTLTKGPVAPVARMLGGLPVKGLSLG
ncbi:ATP-binding protein [Streptomyces sp. ISL-12]|uniref:ATP-binding protein n=1 Tax=Streptomyces sp. ISL-12 TaxID=2819177 RepID=UPI001BE51460|nr:ATP-binding protein [Streptomyces sp. ISL-12]MBT2412822.1 ATP-binding protein [Streptomyces sp. ISL-12]